MQSPELAILRESIQQLPVGIAIYDATGQCLFVNTNACDALAMSEQQILAMPLQTVFAAHETQPLIDKANAKESHQADFVVDKAHRCFHVQLVVTASGYIHVSLEDMTKQKQLTTELTTAKEDIKRLDNAVNGANIGCWDFFPQEKRIVANKAWVTQKKYQDTDFRESGALFSEVINGLDKWSEIVHPDDLAPTMHIIEQHLAGETEYYEAEFRMICGDGQWRWIRDLGKAYERDTDGHAIRMNGVHVDITESKNLEKRIQDLLTTDELTKVKNRRNFESDFLRMLKSSSRNNHYIAFALLDIDFFKKFNDTYGHQEGDQALMQLGQVINQSLKRETDACFRLGGEEFAIVYEVDAPETALKFAQSIKEGVEQLQIRHRHNTASPYLTVSIGLYCKKANENILVRDMYRMADSLLYKAKSSGRNIVKALFK